MDLIDSKKNDLAELFLSDSIDGSTEEIAKSSPRIFVRSQDLLAFDCPEAKGLRLTAIQALRSFGLETLLEVLNHGSAVIPRVKAEPASSIKTRREALGLLPSLVARHAHVSEEVVINAEDPGKRSKIRDLAFIAQTIGLDDISLGFNSPTMQETDFAYRLREWGNNVSPLSPRIVLQFNEAAWVIQKHLNLTKRKASKFDLSRFEPSSNYGLPDYPTWKHGYYLALKTREILKLGEKPIPSMRSLLEETLGIPLIQMSLPHHVAGGTISGDEGRGVFANLGGNNQNVWVRRSTLSHELGHLLWDPEQNLRKIVVDKFDIIDELFEACYQHGQEDSYDIVEARANAFAIEFLAPMSAVKKIIQSGGNISSALRVVMETFGISYTAAKFHVWNVLERKIPLSDLVVSNTDPTTEWISRESFTSDYFKPEVVPESRRGRFAFEVAIAEKEGLISSDTAALWLRCDVEDYLTNRAEIISLFC